MNNNNINNSSKTIQEQEQQQVEQIPKELIAKFDEDEELVQEFLGEGYSQEELLKSSILHATKMDPLCILENGQNAGMWLYADNNRNSNTNVKYTDDRYEQFQAKQKEKLLNNS